MSAPLALAPADEVPVRAVLPEVRPWVWPFLKEWQREGIARAVIRGNQHFWWPCGSGKTLGAVVYALAFPEPVLVLTRASVRLQWAGQVRRFATVEPFVLLPESAKRAASGELDDYLKRCFIRRTRPFLIVGWPSLTEEWAELRRLTGGGTHEEVVSGLNRGITRFLRWVGAPTIVWDESHNAKDHRRWDAKAASDGSNRFVKRTTTAAIAGFLAPRARRRLALTATPQPDRRRDLWAQLDIVHPGCVGPFWSKPERGVVGFAERFCGAFEDTYGWDTKGASNGGELRELIDPWVHHVTTARVKEHMPPLRRETTFLAPESLRPASKEARAKLKEAKRSKDAEAIIQATLEAAATQKDKVVVEIVLDCIASGQKVILFTELRSHSERLRFVILKAAGKQFPPNKVGGDGSKVSWRLWHAHGGSSPLEREGIREEYMAWQDAGVLVGTGDAWGESADLHDTDRLIHVTLPWTWGKLRQRSGRPWRLGGRPVLEQFLICAGTIEEHIAGVVMGKLRAVEEVLPDEHIGEVRDALQGGTDDEILTGLLDRFMED